MDLHGEILRELERDEELISSMEPNGEDGKKNSKTSMGQDSESPSTHEPNEPPDPGRYRVENGRICIEKTTREGETLTLPLCNFTAAVKEELVLDNGADTTRAFILNGALATGEPLPPARVPVSRFAGMSWITEHWGFGAIINAGLSVRDQLREAIQRLSSPPRVRRVFTHTGWHEVRGEWIFLTSSGAVGRDGYEVDLGPDLTRYSLPRTPQDPVEAMQHSLRLLEIAPLTVTVPLLAAVFRAPLASILPLDFSLWLEGFTGSLKSTIAALLLSHFGDFTETASLPGSWLSTVNQLERRAFVLKDVPFVIDDYAPSGADARELESKASRLLRSQGNLASRGRLRSDLTERPGFPPRGIIIGTGEQHPPGQSILARTLLIELERSTVDLSKLTAAQNNATRLSHAMAGYVMWLGDQMVQLPTLLKQSFAEARAASVFHDRHLRIPSGLANLWLGLDCALQYAEEVGSITSMEYEALRSRCWAAMNDVGTKQVLSVEAERPSRRFLRVLAALINQGRASLLEKNCIAQSSSGNTAMVGWQDGEFIYLVPDAAFQTVARFCRDAGEYFPIRSERLWRDLNQEGISDCADGRNSATATIGGQKRRVARLIRERVEDLIGEAWPRSSSEGTIRTDGTGTEK
jgi:hypothetical protein